MAPPAGSIVCFGGVMMTTHKTCVCRLQDGSTPLHYAAAFGQTHVLETLVKAGIAIDNRDDARNTPLHLAAGRASSSSSAAV